MKKFVTFEELNDLTESQTDRLVRWEIQHGLIISNRSKEPTRPMPLAIGEMIEFLDNRLGLVIPRKIGDENRQKWYLTLYTKNEHGESRDSFVAPEFCDALWEAVKKVLTE